MLFSAPSALARLGSSGRLVTWEASGEDCRIVCTEGLLESVRRECALAARGPIPLGMGGALLGEISGNTYRIRAWHPIPCRHQRGPSFLLSKDEVAGLKDFLSQLPARAGSDSGQIVGWFVSHPYSGAALREDEISLHQRFFRARDLFLLIEMGAGGVAEVTVHRGAVPLEPRWRVIPASPPRRTDEAGLPRPPASGSGPGEAGSMQSGRRSLRRAWAAILLAAALAGAGLYLARQFRQPVPALSDDTPDPLTTPSLALEKAPGGFRLRWSPLDPSLAQARRIVVWIRDSGQAQPLELDPETLATGNLMLPSDAAALEVEIRLDFPDGSSRRERVRYQP